MTFIFYLHYVLLTSGLSGTSVLLGVFLKQYSDASQGEIGLLLMSFPFISILVKPLFCSLADKHSAHKLYLLISLLVMLVGFTPFVAIPFFPDFYTRQPRASWWILVLACQTGLGALGVAWSLGDTLAINASQRSKTPYARMRLMGTVSWGVYGYIIGQINEVPSLPKFVPSFLILYLSVLVEILFLLFWSNEDFEMYDPSKELVQAPVEASKSKAISSGSLNKLPDLPDLPSLRHLREMDSPGPGSLSGSLRLSKATGLALRDLIAAEDLNKRLKSLAGSDGDDLSIRTREDSARPEPVLNRKGLACESGACATEDGLETSKRQNKNLQVHLFKLILKEDKRMIKYLILFTMYGMLVSPINFLFLSMESVCKKEGCNFSNLAGSVLISQATIETLAFFVMPWFLRYVSRPLMFTCGLIMMSSRNLFYAGFYYTAGISPYWALLAEWGHGISYGIFATLLADVALMFANQCELFIPQLRRAGFIGTDPAKIGQEEVAIKMALRATMQAVFGGAMDGGGMGLGSLICGLVYDYFGYISLWQLFTIIAISTCVIHQLVEATRSRYSDSGSRDGAKKGGLSQPQIEITLDGANEKSLRLDRIQQQVDNISSAGSIRVAR